MFRSKIVFLFVAVFSLTLLWNNTAIAEPICNTQYQAAAAAIKDAQAGQGLESKLSTKVVNAWRMYLSGKNNSQKNALNQLDVALNLLDSPATKQLGVPARDKIRSTIQAFHACLMGASPVKTATLTINTYHMTYVEASPKGPSAGAGVIILIDETEFGITGADGSITLQVPAGREIDIWAKLYPSNAGNTQITLAAGETRQVDILLDEGKEIAEDSSLVIDELRDGMLDRNFATFNMRFVKDGIPVVLESIGSVLLHSPIGNKNLTDLFVLKADGSLTVNNLSALTNILLARANRAIEIEVHGVGLNGRSYYGAIELFVSRYRVVGRLVAPPSFPGLNVAGIAVLGKILNTNLVLHAVSDSSGAFEFPLLPAGNLAFDSVTVQNGNYYYGRGTLVVNGNKSVSLNMLNATDILNGVPRYMVTPLASALGIYSAEQAMSNSDAKAVRDGSQNPEPPPPAIVPAPATSSFLAAAVGSVYVSAGSVNVLNTQATTLNVVKGTKTVTLTYNVFTYEYPYYVQAQSIFNDTWGIEVLGAGQSIFTIDRQINSQLYMSPIWQSNGSTGQIKETLDIESLAANADITITLFASAMNVGDSILPTIVNASLTVEEVKIISITPDTVVPTTGDSSFYSIPRPGSTNNFQRTFDLKISKPAGSTLKKVTATLLGPGALMTVVDTGVGYTVQEIDASTLRVVVTMPDIVPTPSTVASQPPPTHQISYRFKLFVDVNGIEATAEKDSDPRHALWRMPDSFARYSPVSGGRDAGGDDWSSRGAYNWLEQYRAQITSINDISGEHARNISHATHARGTDIDMYHFYTFPSATTGSSNYVLLRADVLLAPGITSTDPIIKANAEAARGRVIAWVTATRNGINGLAASSQVAELLHILGAAGSGLTNGWGRDLLQTGQTTVNGQALNLGLGTWSNAKYVPRWDHNDHVHITLDRAALGE